MVTPAIRVDGLGKCYRLAHGQARSRYRTLRESIVELVKSPFKKRTTQEEFWALNDVNFEVHPGEVVGIIGRNGAGKSTLLKILSRITKPTKGRVEINGRVGSLLEVGTGFHPELTGRENIYLNGSILGMSRKEIEQKFDEIVAFAEVERFLDTPVKRYSSGMYVRLAFAVAAHLEPEILIVDEVLAVGDSAFQNKSLGKMKAVASSGRTVLFVSHNLTSLAQFCSSGVLLNKGRVVSRDSILSCIGTYTGGSAESRQQTKACVDSRGIGIHEIYIRNADDSGSTDEATLYYPGKYYLECICNMPQDRDLNFGFTIINAGEQPVISTCIKDSGITLPAGSTRLTIELPVGRMPSGSYRIEGAIWSQGRVYVQSDGLLFFSVINQASYLNVRGEMPRGGTLLDLPWQMAKM